METKVCSDCKQEKPVSQYYKHVGTGNPFKRCKTCHAKKTSRYNNSQPPESEKNIVSWLASHGIPAMHGKHIRGTQFKHTDVVAFGCLKVECKKANKRNRIHFSKKQRETRYHADIVIIETTDISYLVYPISYSGFYRDGELHSVIRVDTLNPEKHVDRLDIIESAFKRKRIALMKKAMESPPEQISMFPEAS